MATATKTNNFTTWKAPAKTVTPIYPTPTGKPISNAPAGFNPILGGGNISAGEPTYTTNKSGQLVRTIGAGATNTKQTYPSISGANIPYAPSLATNQTALTSSGAFSPQTPSVTGLGLNASSVPNSSVVNNRNLTPTPAINLAGTNPNDYLKDYSLDIPGVTQPQDTQQTDLQNTQKEQDTNLQRMLDSLNDVPSSADAYNKAQQQSGILQAQQQVNDLTGKLNGIVATGEANKLSLVGQGRGIPEAIIGGQQAQIGRETAIAALPVQAQLSAAQGNLEMANDSLDRLFKIYSDDATNRYNARNKSLEAISGYLDKKEQRLWDEQKVKNEREYEEKQKDIDLKRQLTGSVTANGASSALISSIANAPSYTSALAIKGISNYLISPMEKLQMEKLRGDINKNAAELAAAKQAINGTTGSPVGDIIAGSSRYGDKRLTDSQLEKIQKATSALGSMETLQSLLLQGKDGINVSGPVTGRLRTLSTQLGGDANASAINATIQGLIPTVARGIFGEVGVLTDADIENYRKTVPNLKATGEQNKLISLVMYDVLSRSLENTLVSNAQNQANVSNFLPVYQDTQNRIKNLKANLGVVDKITISPVNKAKMENSWTTSFSPQNITNKLNSLTL